MHQFQKPCLRTEMAVTWLIAHMKRISEILNKSDTNSYGIVNSLQYHIKKTGVPKVKEMTILLNPYLTRPILVWNLKCLYIK